MNYTQGETLKSIKKKHIQIAKELCYGDDIVERIEDAKSEAEIERIMIDARRKDKKR